MDVLPVEIDSAGARRWTYEVAGWGIGELTIAGSLLLAHDLPSSERLPTAELVSHLPSPTTRVSLPISRAVSAATRVVPSTTPKGGTDPPEVMLDDERAQVRADFVSGFVGRVRRQLAGVETSYTDVRVDLSWCTPFQAELAAALLAVPWGEVVSYGELAALAGRPGAARAAGSFCALNRFALVMPCHRVVGAAGIGGYGESGVALKRRLLALEGVEL
jgi:methylated-DNA-[protein]-cysteine S-methyltransferase